MTAPPIAELIPKENEMNQVAQYDPQTGEIMSQTVAQLDREEIPLAVQLAKVELDNSISTAKAYPRSMSLVQSRITDLVMLDEETAEECIYALPRGGKPIKGPSIRFAEIVASMFGNCKTGSRVVEVNKFEKYVEAEGVFIDLESGMHRTARIRRKISDRQGRVYNDDMIVVTGNAASSIALREAILKGVPKALWRKAYAAAESVIAGDVKTVAVRREGAIKAFAVWGIIPEQIFAALEVGGIDDIGLDEIGTLTAMYKAIKAGEQTVEDYFPAKSDKAAGVAAAKGTAGKLADLAKGDKTDTPPRGSTAAEAEAGEGPGKSLHADKPQDTPAGTDQTGADNTNDGSRNSQEGGQGKAGADPADQEAIREAAYERGRKAHGRSMKVDAVPSDLKGDLRDAWVAGWNSAAGQGEGAQ